MRARKRELETRQRRSAPTAWRSSRVWADRNLDGSGDDICDSVSLGRKGGRVAARGPVEQEMRSVRVGAGQSLVDAGTRERGRADEYARTTVLAQDTSELHALDRCEALVRRRRL